MRQTNRVASGEMHCGCSPAEAVWKEQKVHGECQAREVAAAEAIRKAEESAQTVQEDCRAREVAPAEAVPIAPEAQPDAITEAQPIDPAEPQAVAPAVMEMQLRRQRAFERLISSFCFRRSQC